MRSVIRKHWFSLTVYSLIALSMLLGATLSHAAINTLTVIS